MQLDGLRPTEIFVEAGRLVVLVKIQMSTCKRMKSENKNRCRALTNGASGETILLRVSGIECSSTEEGVNRKCPVVAVSECTRFTPATESLGAINSRAVSTCSLGRKVATSVGHLGDGDIIFGVNKRKTGVMIYRRIG